MRLKLVPSETKIDFLKLRLSALGFSGLLVAASIAMFTIIGLNLGIDFRGGILIEARNNEGRPKSAGCARTLMTSASVTSASRALAARPTSLSAFSGRMVTKRRRSPPSS